MSVGFLLKNIRFTLNFLYCLAVVKLYFDLALKDIDELGFFFFFLDSQNVIQNSVFCLLSIRTPSLLLQLSLKLLFQSFCSFPLTVVIVIWTTKTKNRFFFFWHWESCFVVFYFSYCVLLINFAQKAGVLTHPNTLTQVRCNIRIIYVNYRLFFFFFFLNS